MIASPRQVGFAALPLAGVQSKGLALGNPMTAFLRLQVSAA